ncbi:MAG: FtsQ-type POTRA domain-containing protein [Oscillibacter sp.]
MARRKNSNRRRRRGGFGFLYKLLSTLVICGAIVAALTLFFRVDTVVVTGNVRYTREEIVSATGIQIGDNLSLLNKHDVAQNLQQKLPYIELPRINRKYPDTLLIEVSECDFTLAIVQDGGVWYLSPGGKIVEQTAAPLTRQVPVVDGCKLLAPSVGTPIALATEYASQQESLLGLLKALDEAALLDQVHAIHLGEISMLTMDFGGRFTVELPYGADYAYKLRALQTVIGKLESNETGTICLTRDDGRVNFIRK